MTSLICLNPHKANVNAKPLFLVHSILGDPIQDFGALAKLIGNDILLWGLSANSPDSNHQSRSTIKSMAENYLRQIQAIKPKGPYCLGGLSAGGTIAWEIAQQMLTQEEQVTLLLLDSVSPNLWRNLEGLLHTEAVYYLGFFLLPNELRENEEILKRMSEIIEPQTTNQDQLRRLFEYLLATVSDPARLKNIRVAYSILHAIYDYQPQPIDTEIFLFKSSNAFLPSNEQMGWVATSSTTTVIPGNHESFITEPALIAAIQKILEQAGA